ncbi:hypothetical protein [Maricaulis maris]|jgi:hypothetical protein|uniref:hypothetical protein n=1 Tax=Maricaulis maris TaxID=74318 RepID=UPI0026EAD78D|nr:hypothetical protein [Maricaulis maris]
MRVANTVFLTRLGLAIFAAWLAALIISGSIFVIAFELYNPWFHPGGEREHWRSDLIINALGNVFEHGFYPFLVLLLGPIWFLGMPADRLVARTAAILFGLVVGSVIAWVAASVLGHDMARLTYTDDRVLYVASWQRIYVPNFLYVVAAFAMPILAAILFVGVEGGMANVKKRTSRPPR